MTQPDTDAQANNPRSEGLLPADEVGDETGDGRYDIAEEVSLDQQSDTLHHVGEIHAGDEADALAETLKKDGGAA